MISISPTGHRANLGPTCGATPQKARKARDTNNLQDGALPSEGSASPDVHAVFTENSAFRPVSRTLRPANLGRTCGAVVAALAITTAAPAEPDSARRVWPSHVGSIHDSWIEIHAPAVADAVATVTFKNEPVHSADQTFDLSWQGVTVTVVFDWDADGQPAERITVLPPEGYVAQPPEIDAPEGATVEIHIISWGNV